MLSKFVLSSGIIFNLISTIIYSQPMVDYSQQVFPLNHALNTRIDMLPVHPNSLNYITNIGRYVNFHPDFGTQWDDEGTMRQIGIPYNVVGAGQTLVPIVFYSYSDESDPGPWPIPLNPYIETVFDWRDTNAGDRHMLIVDSSSNILYETGGTFGNTAGTEWEGGCGAIFDLSSNELRTDTWTSADAAGLPIFPLLIRYDEVERAVETGGSILHAIRFTAENSQRAYIWPARHYASSSTDPNRPPMGLRLRLKADFDISGYAPRMQVILRTMKKYGIIMSDNGSSWYFQGTHDDRWNGDELDELKSLVGDNFEVVDVSPWMSSPGFDQSSAAVPPNAPYTSIDDQSVSPLKFNLSQNYPNPYTKITNITYSIISPEKVVLKIYTILGTEIETLVNSFQDAGEYTVHFNADKLTGGIYLYQLQVGNSKSSMIKMIVLN